MLRAAFTSRVGSGLFHPVTAAIRFTGAHPGNGQLRSCPPARSASRPGKTLLQPPQPLGFASAKAGHTQQLPGGQGHRHRHAAINTHHTAIIGSGDGFGDGSKSHVPPPRSIQSDAVRLHRVGDLAGPAEAHPADFGYPYLPVAAAEPLEVARFDSDLAESFVPASRPPRRATMCAIKKLRIACAKSRRACCCTVCDPAASQSYSARAAVNWAHCSL
jgi:hypothetical protein